MGAAGLFLNAMTVGGGSAGRSIGQGFQALLSSAWDTALDRMSIVYASDIYQKKKKKKKADK